MASITLSPSGDTTGVTDTAAINNALGLYDEVIISNVANWYGRAGATGGAILIPQNKIFRGIDATSKSYFYLVGSSVGTAYAIQQEGSGLAKGVTVSNVVVDGGRNNTNLTSWNGGSVATMTNGACISMTSNNDYGSNNLVFNDVSCDNGVVQHFSFNSVVGVTMNRCTSSSTQTQRNTSAGVGHGNDFDAVASEKPTTNVVMNDCVLDAYGQESLKYENTQTATHTNCTFNSFVTLTQDAGTPYSELSGISFVNCTFNAWVQISNAKRRFIPAADTTRYTPAMNLTLSSVGVSSGTTAGVTVTAASGTPFATTIFGGAGPVGAGIQWTSGGISGFAIITARTSDTVVTATIVNKFASTTVTASQWSLAQTDNSGAGDVTFNGCSFVGDDAVVLGGDNSGINYGVTTITGCTFTGRNSFIFPTAYTSFKPVVTNCTGIKPQLTFWTRNVANPKYTPVFGTTGIFPAIIKSMGMSALWSPHTSSVASANDGYSYTDMKIVAVNDTYTFASGFLNSAGISNVNRRFSVEAETINQVFIDGTGSTSSFMGFTGSNTNLISVSGFYISGFIGATSSRGITVNAATANVRVSNCYFYNCGTDTNGGGGVRVQAAVYTQIDLCTFDTITGSTSGNGSAVRLDVMNTILSSCTFKNCTTAPSGAGTVRAAATSAGTIWMYGNVFVYNTSSGSTSGMSITSSTANVIFNVFNNSFFGGSAGTNDINIFLGNAATVGNVSNNIAYSSVTTNIIKTGGGVINYGNNCTATAISVASGTNNNLGGNITTNPAFTSTATLTIDSTSPCYGTGALLSTSRMAQIRDNRGRPFSAPISIGAYNV